MKRIAITALALTLAAGSSFAMTGGSTQLRNSVQNDYSRIAPGAELPELTTRQLTIIRGVLSDNDSIDTQKRSRVEFYLKQFSS